MRDEVRDWLEENAGRIGLEDFSIMGKEEGESNHNFILESDGEKYVLRVSREVSRRERLENESKALKLLEEKGIENIPRLEFFEKSTEIGEVLLETFVGQEDIDFAHLLSDRQLKYLAEIIADIHTIKPEETGFEGKSEKSLRQIYSEEFERWSEQPYRKYLDMVDEPDSRIERFYRKQQKLIEKVPEKEVGQRLIHSDLGFNLRVGGEKVFMVDWEYAEIGYPGHDIMILFEHGRLDETQRKIFLDEYRKQREPETVFDKVREIHPRFLAFHDLVWAARRREMGEDRDDMIEMKIAQLERMYGE